MIKRIVFDMDNTLVDEFGATLRPGIIDFLEKLKSLHCELYLWTNSTTTRAKEILLHHRLNRYFDKFIFREDYDPENRGLNKDIKRINGELLIDDDPEEIGFVTKLGLKGYLVKAYRKNMEIDEREYREILEMVTVGEGFMRKIFR